MGVIRWQHEVNRTSAWVGDIMVAEIDIEIVCGRTHVTWEPEGIRFCDGCQIDSVRRYVGSEDEAKRQVEAYIDDWLASAGLMPKPKQRTEADFLHELEKRFDGVDIATYEAIREIERSKQRTEADFRNADIDANGYVTFRDGGAA